MHVIALIGALLGVLTIGGCATVAPHSGTPDNEVNVQTPWTKNILSLWMSGSYADIQNVIEASGPIEKADAEQLAPLCYAYSQLKRYDKLFICADLLERRISAGDDRYSGGWMFFSGEITPFPNMLRAQAYLELGDFAKAIQEGSDADKKITSNYWGTYFPRARYKLEVVDVLALASALQKDTSNAERYVAELEKIEIDWTGAAHMVRAKPNAIARVWIALGRCDKALPYLKPEMEGLKGALTGVVAGLGIMAGKESGIFTRQEVPRQFMLAKCSFEAGQTTVAKAALDEILGTRRLTDQGDIYWLTLFLRGQIAEKEGRIQDGSGFYTRAIEVIEQQRASINLEASKIGFVGDKQAVYGRLTALLVDQGRVADAFDYVERSKARALVDMLAGKRDFAAQGADSQKTRDALAQLDAADMASRSLDKADNLGEGVAATGLRNLNIARQEIRTVAPELATLMSVSSVPSDELKTLIGQEEALVEYYYQGEDLYVFVLNRERLQVIKLAGKGLDEQVRDLRAALERAPSDAWKKPADGLYARLWQPIEGALGSPRNVIVVAHGALHYLPFAALRKPDGSFLIDQYGLRFLPSASVLKFMRPAPPNKTIRILALGNPDLGDSKLDLQFAESEARAVAGLFPDSRILVRKDASETNFKKAGTLFSRIHFATHGKFQADNPLASGLYLAKDADNDGVLTVGELYSMSLDADLVTLSACETGLGKVANGDDVVGLTRGFLYAGSRSIVASLWSVDDNATAELMKVFYRNLASMDKKQALREAQIATRQNFPHPFFWAAFQLTGKGD